ncbi:aprataxin and PNK-like factor isoform X2 [Hoplias malabaricus]|uniref:aprataxin and PNK-like factor isoform X2 n=1 Tax=Hoplias malabaricus TaxID=27720 RepID=UPI003463313D
MPRFELEPVDGGESIDLPYGETVIGRGPFLGVNDKRVSRNHGILENVDGQLRIKPTHLNPCFIQASLEAAPEPLEKDQWHCLKEGSIISLLPGKYVYSVHVVTEENTPRNSQGFEDETQMETKEKSKSSGVSQETLEYNPLARSSASLTSESTLTTQVEEKEEEPCKPDPTSCSQVAVSASKADLSASQTPRRTRVLPAWMTASAPTAPSTSTGKAAKRAPAQTASKTAQSKQTTGPKRARTKQPVSEAEEEEENEEEEEHSKVEKKPRKRARKLNSDTEESQDQATAPKPQGEPSLEDRLSEDSEREEEEEKRRGRKRAEATPGSRARGSEAQNSKKEKMPSRNGQQSSKGSKSEINTASKPNVQRRTPCPYGTSCYRKNPVHFQECSHPGDDDYETEQRNGQEEDEPDDRPECPYGTDCYRKNPQHKKEYKHTKPPAKSVPDDDDDEDEDHYEDSFINDESEEEEVDEDSDYVPESDDSGKEDIKRLQKEAKAFLKKKK